MRAVYASVDPATAILEVAVHETFNIVDTVPHVLTSGRIFDVSRVHVVPPPDIPNPHWVRPGAASAGPFGFGYAMLKAHIFVLIPSVISPHSWNMIFDPTVAKDFYGFVAQECFAVDTQLHPPGT